MKINFTKKEYRTLIDMVCLADWMIHAHVVGDMAPTVEYTALRKKLKSYSKEMGAEDILEYFAGNGECCETQEYDQFLHDQFIDPYDNETFWEELLERLALRDLLRQYSKEQYEKMEPMQRVDLLEDIRERYLTEFEKHGLDRFNMETLSMVES